MGNKSALCQNNGGTAISDTLQNDKKIDVFIGGGLAPLRMYAGMGYFISSKFEGYVKIASMFILPENDFHIIFGAKLTDNKISSLLYTFEAGIFFGSDFNGYNYERNIKGVNLEGGLGYVLRFHLGFYIEGDLKLGFIFQKHEKPNLFPVLDLSIGWTF